MFSSFGDAPGGIREEFQELVYSIGMEYWYNDGFALRVGYINEHENKGNRQYLTTGLSVRYKAVGGSFAYLIPTTSKPNRLAKTFRLGLTFDFNKNNFKE